MEPPGADPGRGLEESMWRLGLAAGEGLPERPGEPDCVYYLRTGSCGYGDKCRFNHPRDRAAVIAAERTEGEYPERHDQPLCQYFLKTGTCKFGAACKYHHPKQGGPVALNYHSYPLRPGEKECSYYMKSGHCKFGVTCKFHHPQPAGFPMPPAAPAFYSPMQQPPPSPPSYPVVAGWQAGRPPLLPGSYMQGAYGPVVFPQGFVPVSGWSAYPPPVNPVVSLGEQNLAQAASMYGGLPQQLSASAPAYLSPYRLVSPSPGPSSSSQKEHNFPERPGQPECQFYMRTGDCKFGPTCRYHHPPQWSMPKTSCALSPIGLPLRPDAPPCTFYMQHGVCKFGPTCKFDHPMGMLGYRTSAFPLVDMPALQYPVEFSAATLAPSSSSSDLRPEFFTTTNMDLLPIQAQLSGISSSSSVGSVFTASRSASQSFGSAFGQSSTSLSSSSSLGHGGEISGSS